jgi:hypothetical protein
MVLVDQQMAIWSLEIYATGRFQPAPILLDLIKAYPEEGKTAPRLQSPSHHSLPSWWLIIVIRTRLCVSFHHFPCFAALYCHLGTRCIPNQIRFTL